MAALAARRDVEIQETSFGASPWTSPNDLSPRCADSAMQESRVTSFGQLYRRHRIEVFNEGGSRPI